MISACHGTLICDCEALPLVSSTYTISAWLGDWHQDYDEKRDVLSFDLTSGSKTQSGAHPSTVGHLDWPASWKCTKEAPEGHSLPLEAID
jgi:lipopolysaccharide transport system ATP-binding protein